MKKLEILNARVGRKNGLLGLVIPDDAKQAYHHMLDYCIKKKGGYVSVIVQPPRKPRATGEKSQSHHFNGHCVQIAQEIGEEFRCGQDGNKTACNQKRVPHKNDQVQ